MIISLLLNLVQAVLILFLPGALLAVAVGRGKRAEFRGPGEMSFYAGLISFAFSSISALILAYLGAFSVARLALLGLLFSLALIPVLLRSGARPLFSPSRAGCLLAPVLLLGLGAALFFRPVPYIFGGWDPGVYVNTAGHLAREGTIFPVDRTAADLEPEDVLRLAWRHSTGYPEKYPGFRYSSPETGRLIPEFYHLFPVWMAVLYSWGGLGGLFCLTPLAGLAALAAFYLALRELWGARAALAAGLLLAFNVAQIWQARFPTAEMLSQFLLFAGTAAAGKYLRQEKPFWAVIAAAAWGLLMLCRITSLLIWPPVIIFFYCRWWKRIRKDDLYLILPLILFTLISFLPQVFGDWRYFTKSAAQFRFAGPGSKPGMVLAGSAVLLAAGLRLLPFFRREEIARTLGGSSARRLLAAAAALLLGYAYFLRPHIGDRTLDSNNLVEIGWLLGPWLLAAAVLGLLLFIGRERSPGGWLFFLIIAVPAAVFISRKMVHYNYMWASRRLAEAVIPGLIAFSIYPLKLASRRGWGGRWFARVVFLLLLVASIRNSRPLFFHREYRGAAEFMEELSGKLAGAEMVFVEGEFVDKIPTPLDLLYGLKVMPVYYGRDPLEPVFDKLAPPAALASGSVYWLRDRADPPALGSGWLLTDRMVFHSPLWERRNDRLPRRADPAARDGNFTVYVFRSRPARSTRSPENRPDG